MSAVAIDPDAIAACWPLSNVSIIDAIPTRWDAHRQVFVLRSDQGTFAAKAFVAPPPTPPTDAADAPAHPRVPLFAQLPYLSDRGYANAPMLLPTRTGEPTATIGRTVVGILEFVPGTLVPHARSRAETWRELGDAAARLNGHADYTHPWSISIAAAIDEVAALAADQDFRNELVGLLPRLAGLEGPEKPGLIHGEINEANAGRRADGSIVLLDWDGAGMAPVVLEYGYPLITQFVSETNLQLDGDAAVAYYKAYRESGGTIDRELLFTAALFHALRYMWFHNVSGRWERIARAVAHESELLAAVL